MKQLLKENIVLVAGIALPLLLAAIFWGARAISIAGIEPPVTQLVFVTGNFDNPESPWSVEVRDGNLHVLYDGSDGKRNWMPPQIYIFNPQDNISRRVDFPRPEKVRLAEKMDIVPDDLQSVRLSTDEKSPDGYIFMRNDGGYNRGLITEVFSGSRDRSQFILKKGNYRRQVPMSGYNAEFKGWVVQ